MMKNAYYIGPAGWSYQDWEGIVYPLKRDKHFHHLRYISQFFDTVEINSSFYRPPAQATATNWASLVKDNPNFCFTFKLWQRYTHERDVFPSAEEEKLVRSGLDPLLNAEKLGALLIQFPWSFKNDEANREWLLNIVRLFRDYHPVVEIRHLSWNEDTFFDRLKAEGVGFANIDQPVIGKSMDLTSISTGEVAYLRLHGRNYDNWFKKNIDGAARYDYLYRENELDELAQTIHLLIEKNPKSFIIFNNHYRGQAIANALQTLFLLTRQKVLIPETMLGHYPALEGISKTGQLSIL